MDWAELRHWPGNLSVITPRRGGTEHGFFRPGGLWPQPVPGYIGNSESARLGLISLINIVAGDQYFEAANPATFSHIDTNINLIGSTSNYTLIGKTFWTTAGNGVLMSYGSPLSGSRSSEGVHITHWPLVSQIRFYVSCGSSAAQIVVPNAGYVDRWVVPGMTIDFAHHLLTAYIDGIQVGQTALPADAMPDVTVYPTVCIGNRTFAANSGWQTQCTAIFNRVLPDTQIKLLSH